MNTTEKDKPKRGRGRPRKESKSKAPQVQEVTIQEYFKMVNDHPEFQKRLIALVEAQEKAQGIKKTAEARAIELEGMIRKVDFDKGEPQLKDHTLEAAEQAASRPTDEQLNFRRKAYKQLAETPYKANKEYRAAAADYYDYLASILDGLEAEFRQALRGEALAKEQYTRALSGWRSQQQTLEGMIHAFFRPTADVSERTDTNPPRLNQAGNYTFPKYDHIGAGDLARQLAEEYKKPIPKR